MEANEAPNFRNTKPCFSFPKVLHHSLQNEKVRKLIRKAVGNVLKQLEGLAKFDRVNS